MADMKPITVIDARMGRGKSSAAMAYMNENKGSKRFLYITPYLTEVERICECCDFDQPDGDNMSKSSELKLHLRHNKNVAATHSLFYLMDDEMLSMIRDGKYSLIIDESIEVVSKMSVSDQDFKIITEQMATVDDVGRVRWIDESYTGRFGVYKDAADSGSLYKLNSSLLSILNPELLRAFDEIYMLTYLFNGQYQKAYLDYFGFEYRVCGVVRDDDGFHFSDQPDDPPPVDYNHLIRIVDADKMNAVGDGKYALSKAWYARRGYDNKEMKELRGRLDTFFRKMTTGESDKRLWTCFKEEQGKLVPSNGRYRKSFLQISARATNQYRDRTDVAYMVNRFADPNIINFFADHGIRIDEDNFALSEMLQWIWRSAIRDDKAINLYIPSKRMRTLLINWINTMNQGGNAVER